MGNSKPAEANSWMVVPSTTMTIEERAMAKVYFPFSFHFPSTSTIVGTYWSPRPALLAIA
jgi:hypothetical protein